MTPDRRSLYRVLHVQPEAPAELIKAAWRCLMTTLRHHPDLGGDHETAARINMAYEVLGNPAKRRQYDESRRRRQRAPPAAETPGGMASVRCCAFCAAPLPQRIGVSTRCTACASPLSPIAHILQRQKELFGRRAAPRVCKDARAVVHPHPARAPSRAQLRDLSLTGVSILTAAVINTGTAVRIVSDDCDLVAYVVQVRTHNGQQRVHGRLLTAYFHGRPGVFVADSA